MLCLLVEIFALASSVENIIEEINRLLDGLEIKFKLIVAGSPTSNDILQIRNKLQKGEFLFSAVSARAAVKFQLNTR